MWMLLSAALAQSPCGPPDACFAEGVRLQVDEGSPTRAAVPWAAACDLGHAMACANLAALHERGLGVPRDLPRAARLYRQACDAGLGIPCAALGVLHANGAGVPQDDAAAFALYQRSCTLGHAHGCTLVGLSHDGGFGVERSWDSAVDAYRQGCTRGDAGGCLTLGGRLAGTRRPEKVAEAVELYAHACSLDEADGCLRAAALLDAGDGVERDRVRAKDLCVKACGLGASAPCCP